jgi:hypothetical protein
MTRELNARGRKELRNLSRVTRTHHWCHYSWFVEQPGQGNCRDASILLVCYLIQRVEHFEPATPHVFDSIAPTRIVGHVSTLAVLSAQETAGESEARHYTESLNRSDVRKSCLILFTMKKVVLGLNGNHGSDSHLAARDARLDESISGVIGATKVANFAFANQLIDGEQCFIEVDTFVIDMEVQEVNVGCPQPGQRSGNRSFDRFRAHSWILATLSDLGGHNHRVAIATDAHPPANHELASTGGI